MQRRLRPDTGRTGCHGLCKSQPCTGRQRSLGDRARQESGDESGQNPVRTTALLPRLIKAKSVRGLALVATAPLLGVPSTARRKSRRCELLYAGGWNPRSGFRHDGLTLLRGQAVDWRITQDSKAKPRQAQHRNDGNPVGGSILRHRKTPVVSFSLLEDGIRAAASVMTAYRYYAVELLIGGVRKIQKPHRARCNIAMTETPLGVPSSGTENRTVWVSARWRMESAQRLPS
ncbi:conserved protein of unknown function [Pseudomonas marincola]|uniref:Uncharacterized protein n=1 Tax=Pseudomonas marincola TaxID=437900 RepID=A0A653E614_9PSED|nr:conserved protein of unknown function [Pseudomonas marincola]